MKTDTGVKTIFFLSDRDESVQFRLVTRAPSIILIYYTNHNKKRMG